ncbi:MAG: CDP-archaeol synthase [Gammaproteobacteria bacterium]|nr:CDP-archaeol synthase [Gammaproteobacteria bacterium]
MLLLKLLFLIMVANGAPILIRNAFTDMRFNCPLDFNVKFFDGRPLLGTSKTIRGLVASLLLTPAFALLVGLSFKAGFTIALFAMLGDSFSSFIKRRMKQHSGSRAPGLDQIPESLFPLLAFNVMIADGTGNSHELHLNWPNIMLIVLVFFILELVLSRVLYTMKIRKHPY